MLYFFKEGILVLWLRHLPHFTGVHVAFGLPFEILIFSLLFCSHKMIALIDYLRRLVLMNLLIVDINLI